MDIREARKIYENEEYRKAYNEVSEKGWKRLLQRKVNTDTTVSMETMDKTKKYHEAQDKIMEEALSLLS